MFIKVTSLDKVRRFQSSYNKGGIWFVWYYAEWCGHCKNMKGEWDVLTKSPPKGINIASVESKSLPKMNNAPNVMGYPTIKLYDNGQEVEDYEEMINQYEEAAKEGKEVVMADTVEDIEEKLEDDIDTNKTADADGE